MSAIPATPIGTTRAARNQQPLHFYQTYKFWKGPSDPNTAWQKGAWQMPTFKRAGKAAFTKKGAIAALATGMVAASLWFPISMYRNSKAVNGLTAPNTLSYIIQNPHRTGAAISAEDLLIHRAFNNGEAIHGVYHPDASSPLQQKKLAVNMTLDELGQFHADHYRKFHKDNPQIRIPEGELATAAMAQSAPVSRMYAWPIGPTLSGAPLGAPVTIVSNLYSAPIGPQLPDENGNVVMNASSASNGNNNVAPGTAPDCTYTTSDKKLNLSTRAPKVAPSVFTYATGGKTFNIPVGTNQKLDDLSGGFTSLEGQVLNATQVLKGGVMATPYTDLDFKTNTDNLLEMHLAADGVVTFTPPEGATVKLDAKYNSEAVRNAWGDFQLDAKEQQELGRRRAVFTVQLGPESYLAGIVTEPGACTDLPASTTQTPVLKQYLRSKAASADAVTSTAAGGAYAQTNTAAQSETYTTISGAPRDTQIRIGVRDDCDVASLDDVCNDAAASQSMTATPAPSYDGAAQSTTYLTPGQTLSLFNKNNLNVAPSASQQKVRGGIYVTNTADAAAPAAPSTASATPAESTQCGYTQEYVDGITKRSAVLGKKLMPLQNQMTEWIISYRDGKMSSEALGQRMQKARTQADAIIAQDKDLFGDLRKVLPCYDSQMQQELSKALDNAERLQKY